MVFLVYCLHCQYVLQALRAGYENKPRDEAWHLLKAGQWNKSHAVLLKHIAADDIIHGRQILNQLFVTEKDKQYLCY